MRISRPGQGPPRRSGRPRNNPKDPLVPIDGKRLWAAINMDGYSISQLAQDMRAHNIAVVSQQVLQAICAGKQKTTRQSIRDGIATWLSWPVTSAWLGGEVQAEAMRHANPSLYLETLKTSSKLVEATRTHIRMMAGDTRHMREVTDEEQSGLETDADDALVSESVKLSIRGVYRVLSWLSWRKVLSEKMYRAPGKTSLEITSSLSWENVDYMEILEYSYSHMLGSAIRLLVDNGAAPLDPKLLAAAVNWIEKHVPLPTHVTILETEDREAPVHRAEQAEIRALIDSTLEKYRASLVRMVSQITTESEAEVEEKRYGKIDDLVWAARQDLEHYPTLQQLKSYLVKWENQLSPRMAAAMQALLEIAAESGAAQLLEPPPIIPQDDDSQPEEETVSRGEVRKDAEQKEEDEQVVLQSIYQLARQYGVSTDIFDRRSSIPSLDDVRDLFLAVVRSRIIRLMSASPDAPAADKIERRADIEVQRWRRRTSKLRSIDQFLEHLKNLDFDPSRDRRQAAPGRRTVDLTAEAVTKAISALPKRHRQVFVMHDVEGFSLKEVAQSLGLEADEARERLMKARAELKERLSNPEVADRPARLRAALEGGK